MAVNKIKEMILMKKTIGEITDFIAKHLIKKFIFKTISGEKCKEIYIYEDGIFTKNGKNIIEKECEKLLSEFSNTYKINEIRNKIERLTMIDRKDLGNANKNLICLKNGVLNLKTKELVNHSPDFCFMNKLPIEYNSKAICHNIFEFLNEILIEEDIDAIQEWFGYQLYREYFIKKAVIFRGAPDTGKTTFMNLLIAFVGEENTCHVSMQMLAEGKWHLTNLYNKYSNICDDLSEKDVTDSGTFKQVTGRSPLHAEIKFGHQFGFINYAKLTFACNKIPIIKTDTDDEAYWDRLMIFDFENIFKKDDKNTNPYKIDELKTKNELSGLLNWAIEGLERLQKQKYFSYRRNWEENRRIMLGEASSIARFANECLINDIESWISNEELFEKYVLFCRLNKISVIEPQRKFAIDLRKYCDYGKFGSNKSNVFGVKNIRIRNPLPVLGM
jgi:putative DNA primase/helicase